MDGSHLLQLVPLLQPSRPILGVDFRPAVHCYHRSKHASAVERYTGKILQTIRESRKLPKLYDGVQPNVLDGTDFESISCQGRPMAIGSGSFGLVYLCRNKSTQSLVTIKLFRRCRGITANSSIIEEMGVQMLIERKRKTHFTPNVMGILLLRMEQNIVNEFHSIALVSEYVAFLPKHTTPVTMSLQKAIDLAKSGHQIINNTHWLQFFIALLESIEELSACNVTHMDLHAENILLSLQDGSLKPMIIDFGKAQLKKQTQMTIQLPQLKATNTPLPSSDLIMAVSHMESIGKCIRYEDLAAIGEDFRNCHSMWSHEQVKGKLLRLAV